MLYKTPSQSKYCFTCGKKVTYHSLQQGIAFTEYESTPLKVISRHYCAKCAKDFESND